MMFRIRFWVVVFFIGLVALSVSAQDEAVTPSITVNEQIVTDAVVVAEVIAADDGWMVIHADADGRPGPVIGFAPVEAGANSDVRIEVDFAAATPVLYAMLHIDTGEIGEYEFGTVDGVDGPVRVDEVVVVEPFDTWAVTDAGLTDQTVIFSTILTDRDGWVVVYADMDGRPGARLGFSAIDAGVNSDVTVELDGGDVTPVIYPVLHADDGTVGALEFGEVGIFDLPIIVNDTAAVTAFNTEDEMTELAATDACVLTSITPENVNIRSAPTTGGTVTGQIAAGASAEANGQAEVGGFTWYRLSEGGWVRGDLFGAEGDCDNLPLAGVDFSATEAETTDEPVIEDAAEPTEDVNIGATAAPPSPPQPAATAIPVQPTPAALPTIALPQG